MDAADRARRDGAADADTKADEAREAILQLWNARATWPAGWPPPRAAEIARLLDDLPQVEDTNLWHRQTILAGLQDLHHRVLATLVDLATSGSDSSLDKAWLDSFGDQLTPDEASLLRRAATRPRHKMRGPFSEADPEESTSRPLISLVEAYRKIIYKLLDPAADTGGNRADTEVGKGHQLTSSTEDDVDDDAHFQET